MKWHDLPDDIITIILQYRKYFTCSNFASLIIQKNWRRYKIKILIERFKFLRYIKDFRFWNPTITEFIIRSKI